MAKQKIEEDKITELWWKAKEANKETPADIPYDFAKLIEQEICQLLEPKPDLTLITPNGLKIGLKEVKESSPDNGRLLTDLEIMSILRCAFTVSIPVGAFDAITNAIRTQLTKDMEWEAKTASIKDKKYQDWKSPEQCHECGSQDQIDKVKAECQSKIDIERDHWKEWLNVRYEGSKDRRELIIEMLEALKKQEGIK